MKNRGNSYPKDEANLRRFLSACDLGAAYVDLAYLIRLEAWLRTPHSLQGAHARQAFARIARDRRAVLAIVAALCARLARDRSEGWVTAAASIAVQLGDATAELVNDLLRTSFASGSLHMMELALQVTRASAPRARALISPEVLDMLGAALAVPFTSVPEEMILTNDPRVVDWLTALLDSMPESLRPSAADREQAIARARTHQRGHAPSTLKRAILETLEALGANETAGVAQLRAGIVTMLRSDVPSCDAVGLPVETHLIAVRVAALYGIDAAEHEPDPAPEAEQLGLIAGLIRQLSRLGRSADPSR